ncbi:hypothetical protein CT676_07825 [Bradyrhizobium sp. MOS001]|uniref:patatin-like phospholipase family protein n=1 Tax=Bradyrhizobium sp. MOS001 TaxID=2133948 RepID=UPI0010753E6F|nr:patatin-like phospholipase family protein [Bradyrhizobium sp. MOS001]TFW61411.1 hypothetical protein CT676_07825 [Bradyrhizobium sp. MOS001]
MALTAPARSEAAPFKTSGLPKVAGIARWMGSSWISSIESGGMHSTSRIKDWIEKNLREVLAEQGKSVPDRLVQFRDLVLPLHVVAADVAQKEPKIWSRETTPDDSVSFAVQASCAIPVYFQPVLAGSSVLVDGGAISNLPTHVFPTNKGYPGRFSDKTLAFRLRSTPAQFTQFEDAKDYALSIADTLVTSATQIQQSLQDGVYSIEIDTGDIIATDFARMTRDVRQTLYDSGLGAVRKFVASEREIVGQHRVASRFEGYDERLLGYVHFFNEARSTIWISDSSTYWLWFIFPALASAIRRGVQVRMAAGPPDASQALVEERRRNLLRAMGCHVQEQPIRFTGILVDYPGNAATAVVSSERGAAGQDFEYRAETVIVYTSEEDLPVINTLGASLVEQVGYTRSALPLAAFAIEAMPSGELFEALATVRHYEQARFDIQEIPLDASLRVSQIRVKEFKLLQVAKLMEELSNVGLELFMPCRYRLPDGSVSIITPPIVEMTQQGPVMIEGHTRAFYASQQGRTRLKVVLVDHVQAALPVQPHPFFSLRLAH